VLEPQNGLEAVSLPIKWYPYHGNQEEKRDGKPKIKFRQRIGAKGTDKDTKERRWQANNNAISKAYFQMPEGLNEVN